VSPSISFGVIERVNQSAQEPRYSFDQALAFGSSALENWYPFDELNGLHLDTQWAQILKTFWQSHEGTELSQFLSSRLESGARIYPATPFRALELTHYNKVNVVILGQDPYHGEGQAHGLAFSVPKGVRPPPSLQNIFKELQRDPDIKDFVAPMSGSLEAWARAGVLLLNTTLTVEQGAPASHTGQGWESLTDQLIAGLCIQKRPIVFMLWGAHAQSKIEVIKSSPGWSEANRLVLTSNHPSPLSALRGKTPFIGNGHFSWARNWLASKGIDQDWLL